MRNTFLGKRIRSFYYALRGAWLLLRKEPSFQVQAVIAVAVTLAGFYFELSPCEWMAQILAIGLVMATEGVNTAIEELADYIQPERDPRIGLIKDVAAGAVFVAALVAVIIGCLIYLPKF